MLARYPHKHSCILLSSVLTVSLAACSSSFEAADFEGPGAFTSPGSGGFGATPGGVKDLGPARQLIKNGQVPPPESFLVEAMYSEHDLPLTGPPCSDALCLRGAAGIAPKPDGKPAGWVQIGMSSSLNPQTYQRPSLTAILCVDVSGSMGWEYKNVSKDYPSSGRLSYLLLQRLAAQLGPQDKVALVAYGSRVETRLDLTRGDDSALLPAIEALDYTGSTNMEAGMKEAYRLAHLAAGTTPDVRVFLFTDENPNVGATSATEFNTIVADGAKEGTALTVFGMGLGVRQDLMNAMAYLRGANAYTLQQDDDVPKLMMASWPWMASPLAYDLKVALTPATGFQVENSYGFPGSMDGTTKLEVSTVFLSQKKGALLLQLGPSAGAAVTDMKLDGTLSFTRRDGSAASASLSVNTAGATLDGRGTYFEQHSVGEAVALALLVSGMKDAATRYATDHKSGVAVMQQTLDRFTADAMALADPALDPEVQLAKDLLSLMQKDAPQGNLYGR